MAKHVIQKHEEPVSHSHKDNELLTVREVSQALRVDDTTTRRWIKNGALEAISLPHVGKRQAYRIRSATLDLLLNTQPVETHKSHDKR